VFLVFGLIFFLAADGVSRGQIQQLSGSLFLTSLQCILVLLHGVPCLRYPCIIVFKHALSPSSAFVLLCVAILRYEDSFK
jgi:hypothetical protein